MADTRPPVNSAGIMTQGAGLTGQLNGGVTASGQRVWMGEDFAKPKNVPYYGSTTTAATTWQAQNAHSILDPGTAKGLYKWLDPEMRLRAYQAVSRISGHDKNADWTVQSYYEKAVDGAPISSMLLGRPVSVFEELDRMGQAAEEMRAMGFGSGGGSGGGGGGGGGGASGPSTTVQYNLSSESDAEMLVDSALNSYLGRQATEKERSKFWSVLNKAQMKNPTVTTTTPTGAGATVMTTGGVNQQQAAMEFALSRKDAAEYMANTQYTDWLMAKIAKDETEGIASGL